MPTVVAMSGGVDSSVAAALLSRQEDDLIGVTLRFWTCEPGGAHDERRSCCGVDGVAAARDVAGHLGIPHYVIDCREAFEDRVLRPAWEAYASGRTPNPCVWCNAEIKFGYLRDLARRRFGAERVATGHHARIEHQGGRPVLLRGADRHKDQSYFLFALSGDQLRSACFPVGRMTKTEVRAIASDQGLPGAERVESQDACLDTEDNAGLGEALRRRFGAPARPGEVVDLAGSHLGDHPGIHRFTVGQRKGLGVSLGRPAYVVTLDPTGARVTVSDDPADLLDSGLVASGLRWLEDLSDEIDAEVQIRYRHAPARARVIPDGAGPGTAVVRFAEPQRAVTPGQAAVVYQGQRVLGGGWIEGSER